MVGHGDAGKFGEDAEGIICTADCPTGLFGGVFLMLFNHAKAAVPDAIDGIVIVGGVGGEGVFWKGISGGRMAVIVAVPMGNSKASDIEIGEVRANVFRHPAEVFGDDFTISCSTEDGAQADVAIIAVGGFIFDAVIGSEEPARQAAMIVSAGLIVIEADEFVVPFWPPWEGVDAIKAEDVIESENLKNSRKALDSLSPPNESGGLHVIPAVEGYSPILTPLLEEGIALTHALWGRAATPVEVELALIEKDIA